MNVSIKLDEGAQIPKKGSQLAAGYDIYSNEDITIPSGERKSVSTGIRLEMTFKEKAFGCDSIYFKIAPRSGLAVKGIDVGAGIVDQDYTGPVKVLLINNSKTDFEVKKGDRIAQGIFERIVDVIFNETKELGITQRGEKGFGSTGTR